MEDLGRPDKDAGTLIDNLAVVGYLVWRHYEGFDPLVLEIVDFGGALPVEDEEVVILEGMVIPGPCYLANRPRRYGTVLMDDAVDPVYAWKKLHGEDVEIYARRSTERHEFNDLPESFLVSDDVVHRISSFSFNCRIDRNFLFSGGSIRRVAL